MTYLNDEPLVEALTQNSRVSPGSSVIFRLADEGTWTLSSTPGAKDKAYPGGNWQGGAGVDEGLGLLPPPDGPGEVDAPPPDGPGDEDGPPPDGAGAT